jgi:predicted O-linked N-acetylglucosamine transferase (SPINDLY family)
VPPEEEHFYTEKIIKLPCVVNHYIPENKPEPSESPVLKNGYITFGSFNRLPKISDSTYKAWAEIMKQLPTSKFLFKINELDYASAKKRIEEIFESNGVDSSRLKFSGKTGWSQHMSAFNDVDISLDPWVHTGGLSSLDSFMMSVPVVTYKWPTIVGRLTASMLTVMGMTDWIAESTEDYIKLAVAKASDIEGLCKVRDGLRDRYKSSILGDCQAYVKAVESEYRKAWRGYCESEVA